MQKLTTDVLHDSQGGGGSTLGGLFGSRARSCIRPCPCQGSLDGGLPLRIKRLRPVAGATWFFYADACMGTHASLPEGLTPSRVGEGDRAFPVAGPSAELLTPEPVSYVWCTPPNRRRFAPHTPVVTGARWGFPARWGGREATRAVGCRLERAHFPVPQVSG